MKWIWSQGLWEVWPQDTRGVQTFRFRTTVPSVPREKTSSEREEINVRREEERDLMMKRWWNQLVLNVFGVSGDGWMCVCVCEVEEFDSVSKTGSNFFLVLVVPQMGICTGLLLRTTETPVSTWQPIYNSHDRLIFYITKFLQTPWPYYHSR